MVVGQVVSGLLFKKIGHVKWQLVGCCVGFTAFLGGMAGVNASNRSVAIAVCLKPASVLFPTKIAKLISFYQLTILAGFCVGFLELITIIIAGLVCKPGDIGLASGLLGSFRQASGSIAGELRNTVYSVLGSIY